MTLSIGFVVLVIFACVALSALTRLLLDLRKKNKKVVDARVGEMTQAIDEVADSFRNLGKNIWNMNYKVRDAFGNITHPKDRRSGQDRRNEERREGLKRRAEEPVCDDIFTEEVIIEKSVGDEEIV